MKKVLFYPDEVVEVDMVIDNRKSQTYIKSLNCFLRQNIKILKEENNPDKGFYWEKSFGIDRVKISKSQMFDVSKM